MSIAFSHGLGTALLGLGVAAQAASLNHELLVNGNAEAGDTSGWISTGIGAITTGGVAPGTLGLPAGTSLGRFVFTGGTGSAAAQGLTQSVDLRALAGAIDAASVTAHFSILVQSRREGSISDEGSGALRFLDGLGGLLATFSFLDPPSAHFDWQFFEDSRLVPAGTRSIETTLLAKRVGGVSSDAYFDNASLKLTSAVPEPGAAWLLLAGLPLLARMQRRKGRAVGTPT